MKCFGFFLQCTNIYLEINKYTDKQKGILSNMYCDEVGIQLLIFLSFCTRTAPLIDLIQPHQSFVRKHGRLISERPEMNPTPTEIYSMSRLFHFYPILREKFTKFHVYFTGRFTALRAAHVKYISLKYTDIHASRYYTMGLPQ